MSFDKLDMDSLLHVLAHVNARGLARVACGGRLGAIMAHEAQQRPALLVLRGSLLELAKALPDRLAVRPTMAVLLYGESVSIRNPGAMLDFVRRRLPPETEVVGARSKSLQCIWNPAVEARNVLSTCEGEDSIGILLATLPEAKAHAFHVRPPELSSMARSVPMADMDCSEEDSEYSESSEDDADFDSMDDDDASGTAQDLGTGAAAVAADGSAPAEGQVGSTKRSALEALLSLDPPPQVIVINTAMYPPRGTVERIQAAYPEAALIGGVVMGQQVMARGKFEPTGTAGRGLGILAICGNAPVFAMTSSYNHSKSRAQADLAAKLRRAKQKAHSDERDVLGTLLFTCNGRGKSLFGREANDARAFQDVFPEAPLLGYYAAGEIGPRISEDEESCFLRGNARLQGFTAVFGFFLVPRKHAPSALFQRAVLYGEVQAAFKQMLSMKAAAPA